MVARLGSALAAFAALCGCSVQPGGAGADCVRSGECELGLVCVEGMCTDNLDNLEDQGQVPVLMDAASADEGMPDAAAVDDAAIAMSDAAVSPPPDTDASAPMSDSGL